MLRWFVFGTVLTVATAVLWAYGVRVAGLEHPAIWTAIGALLAAWIVPLWWVVDTVLRAVLLGLRQVRRALRSDAPQQAWLRARDTGRSWLLVVTEEGLAVSDVPPWVRQVTPTVVDFLLPLAEAPVTGGLEVVAARARWLVGLWRVRIWVVRAIWGVLCLGPFWVPAGVWLWLAPAGG